MADGMFITGEMIGQHNISHKFASQLPAPIKLVDSQDITTS